MEKWSVFKAQNMSDNTSPISKEQFYRLEAYRYQLVRFTETMDFKNVNSQQGMKLLQEINYISTVLDIMKQFFFKDEKKDKPVVAWLRNDEEHKTYVTYRFSSLKVASLAIGVKAAEIALVCEGIYKQVINYQDKSIWIFQYEEDFDLDNNLNFNPNGRKFEFK